MRYVALLRAVNAGGRSTIRMADLRECVEALGHDDVSTYIASGNVLFSSAERGAAKLERELESAIAGQLGLRAPGVVRSRAQLDRTVRAIPERWIGDASLRANVAFLRRSLDARRVASELQPRHGVDELARHPARSCGRRGATRSPAAACRS